MGASTTATFAPRAGSYLQGRGGATTSSYAAPHAHPQSLAPAAHMRLRAGTTPTNAIAFHDKSSHQRTGHQQVTRYAPSVSGTPINRHQLSPTAGGGETRASNVDLRALTRRPEPVTRAPTAIPEHMRLMHQRTEVVGPKPVTRAPTALPDHLTRFTHYRSTADMTTPKTVTRFPTATFEGYQGASTRKPLHRNVPTAAVPQNPLPSPTPVTSSRRAAATTAATPLPSSRLTLPSASKAAPSRHIAAAMSGGSNLSTTTTPTAAGTTTSGGTYRSAMPTAQVVGQNSALVQPQHSPHTSAQAIGYKQPASYMRKPLSIDVATNPFGLDPKASRELLNKRLDAKHLNPGRIIKEAPSQVKALCVSPDSGKCYKITRVLQSAIYGGVFEAEMYYVRKVLSDDYSAGGLPIRPEKKVALKIMLRDLEIQHRDSLQEDITAEFKFKNEMQGHPNVLAYDELWESQSKGIIYVVMPFAEFEDLFEVLKRRSVPFSEPEARWLFRQLLMGVQHLHNQGVGFRDHSLENVLMFRSETDGTTVVPKITDPGQAVKFRFDLKRREVCCMYAEKLFGKSFRPPEVYNPRKYNPIKVDVFCIGWMLFFVVTKRQPFDRTMDTDPHWKYVVKGDFDELLKIKGNAKLSSKLISLLKNMLHPQYENRFTPKQCLEDPWFQEAECPIDHRTIWGSSSNAKL